MTLPLEGCDYFIYYMEMPPKIWAFVQPNDDGTFSVFLDPRRSNSQQKCDLDHEIRHIIRDDLYNGLPIYICEEYEM